MSPHHRGLTPFLLEPLERPPWPPAPLCSLAPQRDSVLWGGFSNCHAYLIFILTFSPFSAALDPVDRPILYKPLVAHLLAVPLGQCSWLWQGSTACSSHLPARMHIVPWVQGRKQNPLKASQAGKDSFRLLGAS